MLFGYDVIRGIQQATSISFFLLWGIKVEIERKHILHSWVGDQSTDQNFPARSPVPP